MEKSFGLMFYQKKTKKQEQGTRVPIYVRITTNGKQVELSTKQKCSLAFWNASVGRLNGKSEEAKGVNAMLDLIEQKIYAAKRKLMEMEEEVTSEKIKCLVQHKSIGKKEHTLLEAFKVHNEQMKELIGIDYAPATYKRYETTYEHTARFLKERYKVNDLPLGKLAYEFITDFEYWFKTKRKCSHNTTMKYLGNVEKIIHICLAKKWITTDPFLGFKKSKMQITRIPLSEEEVRKIATKKFDIERLSVVRDMFLFCCFTGLAYVDMEKLKQEDIFVGVDGNKWINCIRQKSKCNARIPLLPAAEKILDKYAKDNQLADERDKVLPVKSNQKMNAYLKEIADLCGIKKKLTTHIARHTFATTVTLSNNIPIETVSKMLGHQKISTTQIYAKIIDQKVSADMQQLRNKFVKAYV